MDEIIQMIKEICTQDANLDLVRIEYVPSNYDPIDDTYNSEMVVACIDAQYKQQIYAMLGDFVENFESLTTNILAYNMNGIAHTTIEIMYNE